MDGVQPKMKSEFITHSFLIKLFGPIPEISLDGRFCFVKGHLTPGWDHLIFQNSEPNSRLANLKRRLTMMSNKMTSADHDQADVGLTDDRKRSIDEQAGDDFVFEG